MRLDNVRFGAAALAALVLATGAQAQSPTGDQRWLLGYWTDNADSCVDMIEFRRDGTFFTEGNGRTGRWRLQGNQLTFSAAITITARLERLSRDRIRLHQADGAIGHSYRCTGDSTPADRPLDRR